MSRRQGGLGLGLAISRALVDLLGGMIAASSEGLGKGSHFQVSFPTIEVAPGVVDGARDGGATAVEGLKLRILLVEDHADTGVAMSRLLLARGHEVDLANSVRSALAVIDEKEFDLMLCDLGLPDGSGIEVVKYLRTAHTTPAIALSGFGMEEDLARCLDAGFDLHLTKPVNVRQLEWGIGKLLDGKERLDGSAKA